MARYVVVFTQGRRAIIRIVRLDPAAPCNVALPLETRQVAGRR